MTTPTDQTAEALAAGQEETQMTYANFAALMAAIQAGTVKQANIEVFIDNDSVPFMWTPDGWDGEAEDADDQVIDLLEGDKGPRGLLKEVLQYLGFTEFTS